MTDNDAPSFGGRRHYARDDPALLLFDRAVNLLDGQWDGVAEEIYKTFDQSDGPHPVDESFFSLGTEESFENAFFELRNLIQLMAREPKISAGVIESARELLEQICTLENIAIVGPGEEPALVIARGTPRIILYDDDETAPENERGYEAHIYKSKRRDG